MAADLSNETQANAKTEESIGKEQPQATYRGRELEWRRTHGEVLRTFAGEWVVLEGEEIIAHGDDPIRVVAEARAKGIKVPYLFYVETTGEDSAATFLIWSRSGTMNATLTGRLSNFLPL